MLEEILPTGQQKKKSVKANCTLFRWRLHRSRPWKEEAKSEIYLITAK